MSRGQETSDSVTRITDSGEPPHGCCELNPGPRVEQQHEYPAPVGEQPMCSGDTKVWCLLGSCTQVTEFPIGEATLTCVLPHPP